MPKFRVQWKQYFTKHFEDIIEATSADEAAKLATDKNDTNKGLTSTELEATVVTRVDNYEK